MIDLLFTKFTGQLPDSAWEAYWKMLPVAMREKNARYLRWKDRHAHLFGILLLVQGLGKYNLDHQALNDVRYTSYNRPFLNHEIDFNISHSGNYVLCALGKNFQVGVDIEEVRAIDFRDFDNVMSDEQMKVIHAAADPMRSFFNYWTIKESVIKADGRGLSIPLTEIRINGNIVECDRRTWHVEELAIDTNYCAHLACPVRTPLQIAQFDFYNKHVFDQVTNPRGVL